MDVSTILNSKGGTGKTTFASNVAALLADLAGQRVLMVDGDKQPTLSSIYDLEHRAPHGIDALMRRGATDPAVIDDCISRTVIPRLDVVVSDAAMGELESWVLHTADGRLRLRAALQHLRDRYDHILIDTCGAVGALPEAAIVAADQVLSPLPPAILPAREFARGTLGMMARTTPLLQMLGGPLPPVHVIPYMVDRTADARDLLTAVREPGFGDGYAGDVAVLAEVVPATVLFRQAARERIPVHQLPRHRRSKASAALAAVTATLFPHSEPALQALLPQESE